MYEGPVSPGLTVLHAAVQYPAIALCIAIAGATYIYVTPDTDLPVQLPAEVEPTQLYDGVTGRYMTLGDLADENIGPDRYDAQKGATTVRCYVTEGPNGECYCVGLPKATK